jgi:flagellar biosynthetic protein FliR
MIMKAVPQINIFSIEIQMKLVLGIIILIVSVPVLVAMSDNLVSFMLEKSTEFLKMLIPSS